MTAKRKTAKKKPQEQTCPYLGLRDDPDTHMAFPSPLNYCQRGKRAAPVKLEHQSSHCLDANHLTCPVYTGGADVSFPRELRGQAVKRSEYIYPIIRKRTWGPWLLTVVFIVLLGAGYWFFNNGLMFTARLNPTPFRLAPASATPESVSLSFLPFLSPTPTVSSGTPTSVWTATVTPFPTLTPTPDQTEGFSPTATQISLHSLEMPIGPVQKYLIHQISAGENLTELAARYRTSVDAVMMVNITLKVPIRKGDVVIMPVDMSNPNGLPALEPYQVEYDQMLVEALASELNTDPTLLKYFNLYKDGERLRKGDWILVPRLRPEVP